MGRINKTNKSNPVSADEFIIYDSQDTTDDKNITLGQVASFTEKQKENEMKIYDTLESNGFIDKMIEVIPEEEYNALFTFMDEIMLNTLNYTNTAGAVIQSIINDLPKNAKIAKDIIDSFDKESEQHHSLNKTL